MKLFILTPRRYKTRLTLGSVILGDWPLTVKKFLFLRL